MKALLETTLFGILSQNGFPIKLTKMWAKVFGNDKLSDLRFQEFNRTMNSLFIDWISLHCARIAKIEEDLAENEPAGTVALIDNAM